MEYVPLVSQLAVAVLHPILILVNVDKRIVVKLPLSRYVDKRPGIAYDYDLHEGPYLAVETVRILVSDVIDLLDQQYVVYYAKYDG